MEKKDAEIDEEVSVGVIFDEEEREEEDEEGFEINEESDEEEEGQEAACEGTVEDGAGEELIIGGDSSRVKTDKDIASPLSIDGFWVQRYISEIYPGPVTAAEKTTSVLSVLGSESSARGCENQPVELFDFQSFYITAKFLTNRDIVVWCTKLMRSDTDERVNVEVAMREKEVGWILRELAGDGQAKPRSDAMHVDEPKIKVFKTATVAPSSIAQPKRTVSLDSMAFSQGRHLMSNKKCKLPDGSFKRAKKGYEEIHVPAPKQKPTTETDIVPMTALPAWARKAFTVPKLNRVQSKVFPVAFVTDELILLWAPTGTGKVCLYVDMQLQLPNHCPDRQTSSYW